MLARILDLPFFVLLMGIGAASMYVPAAQAAVTGQFEVMRAFFNSANLLLVLTSMIALATANRAPENMARNHLLALFATFALLPAMLAIPFVISVPDTGFLDAYVEMVSSITTTGATLYAPERLPDAVHLWRAQVGWMGGFFVWVTAVAILAPMNLGGFEVVAPEATGRGAVRATGEIWATDGAHRLRRFSLRLFPIYAGLTAVLWVALLMAGERPLVAVSHAMSVLATSGISPVGGLEGGASGFAGEAVIFLFLFFAVSRQTFSAERLGEGLRRLLTDPEFRLGLLIIGLVPLVLFARHWLGAMEVSAGQNLASALKALWGGVFTVASFLTTTGFESAAWDQARGWSGLETPGTILIGLALIGGGVATTAGGVKLLRVYALYKHGMREMERLVQPSSVGGAGRGARRLRRQGAYMAWMFFMLFALSLSAITAAFSMTGLDFEQSTVLATAALSTTGPLAAVGGGAPISYAALSEPAKGILAAAMVLGRLETLAIIALLNPDFWRR